MAKNFISKQYDNLDDLSSFLAAMPEGTTADLLASDLEAGNFNEAVFSHPNGYDIHVQYSGPVAEGYSSPFEQGIEDL